MNDEVCISGLYACIQGGEKAFGKCLISSSMGLENIGHAFFAVGDCLGPSNFKDRHVCSFVAANQW